MNIKELIDGFKVTVTDDFIDYINSEFAKKTYSARKTNMNFLALEYYLIKMKLVDPATHSWRNDLKHYNDKLDLKHVSSNFFNIESRSKVKQLIESENMDELDYLLFYNQICRRNNKIINTNKVLLSSGDELNFKFIAKEKPHIVMQSLEKSWKKNNGYFVRMSAIS